MTPKVTPPGHINPRPDTVFRHLRSDGGGGCDPSLAFPNEAL